MKRMLLAGLFVAMAAAVAVAKPMPSDYQVLMRKSIFAKDRRARVERSSSERAYVPPRPKVVPVLVGTVVDEEEAVALIESPDTGAITRAHVNEVIAGEFGGTVTAITLEGIELTAPASTAGEARKIAVGQNMQGDLPARPAVSAGPATTESATTSAATSSAEGAAKTGTDTTTSAPAGADDVLERMRRRRQQELNR